MWRFYARQHSAALSLPTSDDEREIATLEEVAGYAAYPGYGAPYPVACPGGYWARRPVVDPYGNVVGYSRPRFFCPPA